MILGSSPDYARLSLYIRAISTMGLSHSPLAVSLFGPNVLSGASLMNESAILVQKDMQELEHDRDVLEDISRLVKQLKGQYPVSQYPAGRYPVSRYPVSQYPAGRYPAGRYPVNRYPAGRYPVSRYPAGRYPVSRYPVSQYPAGRYPVSLDFNLFFSYDMFAVEPAGLGFCFFSPVTTYRGASQVGQHQLHLVVRLLWP